MSTENQLWGAPRLHGELLKLGFSVAQSTVAKYMVKRRGPPSPAGQPLVGIGDGWSGRVTGGVTFTQKDGASVALGGEYGGFGANYKIWTASGRVFWPF